MRFSRHLRNHLFILIFFLLVCLIITGIHRSDVTGQDLKRHHILWEVTKGKGRLYILGSIHVLRKDSYPLPPVIEKIYRCCKKIVFETDIGKKGEDEFQQKMMKLALYPKGQRLSKNISSTTYTLMKKKAEKVGIDVSNLEPFRPWFVAIAIAGAYLQKLGLNPDLGIDRYFFMKAVRDKKEIIFLETPEFQINLFAGLDSKRQEMVLRQMLSEVDVIEKNFNEMIDAWLRGDVHKLASIIKEGFEGYPEIYKRFIVRRNKRWFLKLKRLLSEGEDVLVIVGSAHLVGDGSLVDLMKKSGYKVRQL